MTNGKKKKIQKENDLILEIGKEGKEGVKNAKEYFKSQDKKDQKKEADLKTFINSAKKGTDYNRELAKILSFYVDNIPFTKKWKYRVIPTQRGVVLELEYKKRHFRTAFAPTFSTEYDFNAIKNLAIRAENTFDKIMGQEGIVL